MIKTFKVKNENTITTEVYFFPLFAFVDRAVSIKTEKVTTIDIIKGVTIGWFVWTWFIPFPKSKRLNNKLLNNIMES